MPQLNVSRASELDEEHQREVVDVYQEGYPETGLEEDEFLNQIRSPNQELYVISLDTGDKKKPVAAGMIEFSYDDFDAQLSDAVVKPELRGKGLGKTLFNLRNERAMERGNGRVYTWASTDYPGVQAIAAQNGYVPAGIEVEEKPPNGETPSKNILMVNPDTLQDRSRELYATESTIDTLEGLLNGTQLGESVDREINLLEPQEQVETGYLVSTESGHGGYISFGIEGVGSQEKEFHQQNIYRKVSSGTIDDAMNESPHTEIQPKISVNISSTNASPVMETLVEKGYQPTTIQLDTPLTTKQPSPENTVDDLIFEKTNETHQLGTTEKVEKWLDEMNLPAEPR